jgi:hypothetical protein
MNSATVGTSEESEKKVSILQEQTQSIRKVGSWYMQRGVVTRILIAAVLLLMAVHSYNRFLVTYDQRSPSVFSLDLSNIPGFWNRLWIKMQVASTFTSPPTTHDLFGRQVQYMPVGWHHNYKLERVGNRDIWKTEV